MSGTINLKAKPSKATFSFGIVIAGCIFVGIKMFNQMQSIMARWPAGLAFILLYNSNPIN
jgi:hypothetical protein